MKRHVISVLLSLTTVLSFSQVPTQGGRTDSIDVGMFMIVEGVDSPYVEIYLSPQKSYVVESHFCEEDEKVELPTKIAADLFSMMYGFFVSKETDIIEKSDSLSEDTIPFDLIQIPLIHNASEPMKLLFVSHNRDLEGKAFSNAYIRLTNTIHDIARNYRQQLVSHAEEIDTETPVLQVDVPKMETGTEGRPFYSANIICKFESLGKDTYEILLTPSNGIIQDTRKKFFYKFLPGSVTDWLYGKIQKYVLSITKIQDPYTKEDLMGLGIGPYTLILWDDDVTLSAPSVKERTYVECRVLTDDESKAMDAANKIKLMTPQDIKVVQEICRQYRENAHK